MLNMQNVKDIEITEGDVRTIHDKDSRLIWGRLAYDTKYAGDTTQATTTGKNLFNVDGDFSYGGYITQTTKNGDGTITVSNNFSVSRNAGQKLNLLANTTYTLSCDMTATTSTSNNKGIIEIMKGIRSVNLSNIAIERVTAIGNATLTFTTPADVSEIWVCFNSNGDATSTFANIQIEQGSTPTSYEPYTGGIPAPNPDYPQPIQVVTGEQTVKVTGKNLFNIKTATGTRGNNTVVASNQTITVNSNTSGTETAFYLNDCSYISQYSPSSYANARDYNMTGMGGDYTLKVYYQNMPLGTGALNTCIYTTKQTILKNRASIINGAVEVTISLDNDEYIKSVVLYTSNTNVFNNFTIKAQLESDVTATAYEPYQSQSYTVDLGSTELCKIGDYQDYIYKSNGDWYVHKTLGKYIFDGSETIAYNASNHGFTINPTNLANYLTNLANPPLNGVCTHFKVNTTTSTWVSDNTVGLSSAGTFWCKATSFANSQGDCETWLTANTPTIYYGLATPIDTKITNATLLGQLDAIHEWLTRYGYSSTVTGNLPIIINQTNL